jgi:hypothetical protein
MIEHVFWLFLFSERNLWLAFFTCEEKILPLLNLTKFC